LFPDVVTLAIKPCEDFSALVQGRLAQHKAERQAAQARVEAEAARREEQKAAQARLEAEAAIAQANEKQRQADVANLLARQQKLNCAVLAEQAMVAAVTTGTALVTPKGEVLNAHQIAKVDEPATLPLGRICERLGMTVTADFLERLGFAAHRDRNAKLYRESDFAGICEAISAHVLLARKQSNRREALGVEA
jgi:hypothetical protein